MNYLFWILCALIVVIALLFVVLPLWRNSSRNDDVQRDAANLEIFRDQITEMDADLRNGILAQELYEQGKNEIQARLLKEVKTVQQSPSQPGSSNKKLAILLAILLPLFTIPLYLYLGNFNAALPLNEKVEADSSGIIRSEAGIKALESQLKIKPENPNGWFMLANSYIAKKRYTEGANAYEQLVKFAPDEAQVWANYADVYAMANGQTLQSKEVSGFLEKALALDSNNMTALALSGSAALERGDYVAVIENWQKLLSLLPPGSSEAMRFEGSIKRARDLLAAQPGGKEKLAQLSAQNVSETPATDPAKAVSGKVSLSPALAAKVAPTDTVFILARAAQGPKMPLAVFRKQVKDLPLEFTLDDSMAMQPQLKLSGFDQIVVVARVSKSGTPMAQPGDLEGLSGAIKPGSKGLKIVIDSVVP